MFAGPGALAERPKVPLRRRVTSGRVVSTMVSTRADRGWLAHVGAGGGGTSIASGRVKARPSVPWVLFPEYRNIRRTGDSEPGLRPDPRETTDGNSPPAA